MSRGSGHHGARGAGAGAAEAPCLPDNPFPTDERVAVSAGKTPYVRFDRNDSSIPATHVRCTLTVMASPTTVRVLDGATLFATHPCSYDKGRQVEDPAHIAALVARKREARQHRGTDRLAQASPGSRELLTRAAERGENLGSITATLLRLLERYSAAELEAAYAKALARGVPHPNAARAGSLSAAESSASSRHRWRSPCPMTGACVRSWSCRTSSTPTTKGKPPGRATLTRTTTDDPLLARAKALQLHGLVAHWPQVAGADGDRALRHRLSLYARPRLLFIDEIGYLSYSNRHADLLFEVVSRRYQEKSTLVTTNRPFAEWGEVFPNAACVVSLVDRLSHNAEIIRIKGGSYRLKEAKERSQQRRWERAARKTNTCPNPPRNN